MSFFTRILLLPSSLILLTRCENAQNLPFNIIYITVEDMSPYLNCYGYDQVISPNFDAFAMESVLLEDVHCQVALCTPSRTSILTGIRPQTSGIVKINDDWRKLLPDAVSLPRHFRNHGYYTYGLGKISDPRNGGMDSAWNVQREEWGIADNAKVKEVVEVLAGQDRPFFWAIGYKQAHDPWKPASQHLVKYETDSIEILGSGRVYRKENKSDREIKEMIRSFYASITEVDSLIGDLMAEIKGQDWYDNSIIVLGALDHGYSLGLHSKWGKGDNYDNETHVPLMIRVPGNPNNGRRSGALVELVDIYPTLIDYAALPDPPQKLEGCSLRKLLEKPERSWKQAIFSTRAYHLQEIGIKTNEYTLLTKNGVANKLYNRQRDPNNLVNILDEDTLLADSLLQWLDLGWEGALPK